MHLNLVNALVNMKSLNITIHSFVDVITNSSTEVYIHADGGTVSAVKELVDNILDGAGSTYRFDDLFVIELRRNGIIVTPKSDGDVPNLSKITEASSTLSNLSGLFDITAETDS